MLLNALKFFFAYLLEPDFFLIQKAVELGIAALDKAVLVENVQQTGAGSQKDEVLGFFHVADFAERDFFSKMTVSTDTDAGFADLTDHQRWLTKLFLVPLDGNRNSIAMTKEDKHSQQRQKNQSSI